MMKYDAKKFKALVHYIIWRAGRRQGFGAVKLNKVLWFADAHAYLLHRKPITGTTYIREKFGPVPRQIIERFQENERPNMAAFSAKELSIIDWWIKHIVEDHTADSISEQSHDYAWEIAAMGEEIPLYAVFAERIRAPRGKELEWAKAEAERLALS